MMNILFDLRSKACS